MNTSRLQPATLKFTLFHGCFSRFLHCTNGTKSRNAPHIVFLSNTKIISYQEGLTTYDLG